MAHNIQKILRTNDSPFEKLESFGVYAQRSKEYPELYQFSYDQIESAKFKDHPVVIESRGIILNSEDNWNVVAYPFNRFFNYGEVPNIIDWKSARVQDKLDGSLMFMYYYKNAWRVSTKGSVDASGNVGENSFTFKELFWNLWDFYYKGKENNLPKTQTYMFELTSMYNRIVTNQSSNPGTLTLIGVRSNREYLGNYQELNNRLIAKMYGLNYVQEFPLTTINEVLKAAESLDPSLQEGFVVVDKYFQRIKIKSPKYVLIHHLKDSFSVNRMLDLIRTGESSEVFVYFPDIEEKYNHYNSAINNMAEFLDSEWKKISATTFDTQKDFALFLKNTYPQKIMDFFFSMKKNRYTTAKEWLLGRSNDSLLEILEVKCF